ncbi:MAG: hypothetical protein KDD44_04745, partial [Bdellovibrionales bacterium]|nr:hypothetical protein [Bdellovibrionales bacterium]
QGLWGLLLPADADGRVPSGPAGRRSVGVGSVAPLVLKLRTEHLRSVRMFPTAYSPECLAAEFFFDATLNDESVQLQ